MSRRHIPKGVEVYEAEGAFFFGVAELLRDHLEIGRHSPVVLILRMRHVLALDASGIRALNDLRQRCARASTTLILERIHAQPLVALEQANLLMKFNDVNVVSILDLALQRANELLATP